jgi:hypothetical protein
MLEQLAYWIVVCAAVVEAIQVRAETLQRQRKKWPSVAEREAPDNFCKNYLLSAPIDGASRDVFC